MKSEALEAPSVSVSPPQLLIDLGQGAVVRSCGGGGLPAMRGEEAVHVVVSGWLSPLTLALTQVLEPRPQQRRSSVVMHTLSGCGQNVPSHVRLPTYPLTAIFFL